ncbi:hypothetical protein OIB37_11540 [Streptomyces sp. NBC_00820]|uniref:DUF6891 domain-containing protein n=1 Tax=Streptomyces sp. NBC_00820 TaxID=2975842 RepID=UPI002ED66AD6|nr:hypothetical protein OIB37_11540 [Streptomyces sp. NBC_00820]
MENDEVLSVKVLTEYGRMYQHPSADTLRELTERIGGIWDRLLILQRIPDVPDVFAQVWHEEGGDYRLEHRRGDEEFSGANLTHPGQVADLLTGWARRQDDWDRDVAWEPVDLEPRPEVPPLPEDVREQVEERVRLVLRCGYDTRSTATEAAVNHLLTEDERPVSPEQGLELVNRLWLERLAEQETWQGVTDPERLTLAFGALAETGIRAREDFTCCSACGMAEIGADREDLRGFVFFHREGTEAAADGHGLHLYFGAFDGSAETTTAVGQEVVAALEEAGLSTMWDGNSARAIEVTPLTWHRRLVG